MEQTITTSATVHTDEWYQRLLNLYSSIYNTLYDFCNYTDRYDALIDMAEQLLRNPAFRPDLNRLVEIRHDFFTSDREIVALALAYYIFTL